MRDEATEFRHPRFRRPSADLDGELKIFSGNAHAELASSICRYLELPLGQSEVFEFSNENIFVRIMENVRERDVFIIQPLCSPVNRSIMELLIMIDAMKRASAARITAVLPYYGYGRTDKKDQPRVPITARLIADMIEVAGAHRVLTMDLHAGQIQGFFNIPVDELTAVFLQSRYFNEKALVNPVVVATDVGIAKRARNVAAMIHAPLAIIEKRRIGNSEQSEDLNVIGDVAGRTAVIFDDEIDTAGSLIEATRALRDRGAGDLYACCTHAIFSGPAVGRIAASLLTEVVVTDTVPLRPGASLPQVKVLSVASLFGEAIQRIHTGSSVGALFQ